MQECIVDARSHTCLRTERDDPTDFVNYLKYLWSAAAISLGLKCEKANPFQMNTQFAAVERIYFPDFLKQHA